jgi:phage terminase small subunit
LFKIRKTPREARLSEQYVTFAREYVVDLNAERAASVSGLGYLDNPDELLRRPRVAPIIKYLQAERSTRLGIKADRVIEELARIAFSNMLDYLDERGNLDLTKLSRDTAAAIQEIREDTTGGAGDGERRLILRTTFKLADKLRALDMLSRHLGLYAAEKIDVNVNISVAQELQAARKRLEIIECKPKQIA